MRAKECHHFSMNDSMNIFDRKRLAAHKRRAAPQFLAHAFLFNEAADRLTDRLEDITYRFPCALEIGAQGSLSDKIMHQRGGVQHFIHCSPHALLLDTINNGSSVLANEEMLPFAANSVDMVISNLSLQWVNDLPGCLAQIKHILKPDGLFLATLPGTETLKELRAALLHAEMQTRGGTSPRISPFVDVRDAGALLQRAGFALPVVDSEIITVTYDSVFTRAGYPRCG